MFFCRQTDKLNFNEVMEKNSTQRKGRKRMDKREDKWDWKALRVPLLNELKTVVCETDEPLPNVVVVTEQDYVAMTVINDTLAWGISGDKDPSECIDADPEEIYGIGQKIKMEELIRMAEFSERRK